MLADANFGFYRCRCGDVCYGPGAGAHFDVPGHEIVNRFLFCKHCVRGRRYKSETVTNFLNDHRNCVPEDYQISATLIKMIFKELRKPFNATFNEFLVSCNCDKPVPPKDKVTLICYNFPTDAATLMIARPRSSGVRATKYRNNPTGMSSDGDIEGLILSEMRSTSGHSARSQSSETSSQNNEDVRHKRDNPELQRIDDIHLDSSSSRQLSSTEFVPVQETECESHLTPIAAPLIRREGPSSPVSASTNVDSSTAREIEKIISTISPIIRDARGPGALNAAGFFRALLLRCKYDKQNPIGQNDYMWKLTSRITNPNFSVYRRSRTLFRLMMWFTVNAKLRMDQQIDVAVRNLASHLIEPDAPPVVVRPSSASPNYLNRSIPRVKRPLLTNIESTEKSPRISGSQMGRSVNSQTEETDNLVSGQPSDSSRKIMGMTLSNARPSDQLTSIVRYVKTAAESGTELHGAFLTELNRRIDLVRQNVRHLEETCGR